MTFDFRVGRGVQNDPKNCTQKLSEIIGRNLWTFPKSSYFFINKQLYFDFRKYYIY